MLYMGVFLGMGVRIFLGNSYLFTHRGGYFKTEEVSVPFLDLFLKKDSSGFFIVCHIAGR